MNNKGEVNLVGMLIVLAITLIVGLVLFQVIAQEVGKSTNTISLANQSLGDLNNGTLTYVTNCRALSNVAIFNATGDVEIPSDEYTVTNNVVYNGALAVSILPNVDITEGYDKGVSTIDATCQPLTYIAESGARSMAGLIVVMFALALAVVALTPTLREGILESLGR